MQPSYLKQNPRQSLRISEEGIISGVLILGSIAVSIVFSIIASNRALTSLEAVLLQSFGLGAGILGSFIFGRQSAGKAAREMVKPHSRSAFRRVLSLYQSLSRLASVIENAKYFSSKLDELNNSNYGYLPVLEAIVTEQLSTANDALEDWRDLIPEDIQELERRIKERKTSSEKP